jgi:hypothetical protein
VLGTRLVLRGGFRCPCLSEMNSRQWWSWDAFSAKTNGWKGSEKCKGGVCWPHASRNP